MCQDLQRGPCFDNALGISTNRLLELLIPPGKTFVPALNQNCICQLPFRPSKTWKHPCVLRYWIILWKATPANKRFAPQHRRPSLELRVGCWDAICQCLVTQHLSLDSLHRLVVVVILYYNDHNSHLGGATIGILPWTTPVKIKPLGPFQMCCWSWFPFLGESIYWRNPKDFFLGFAGQSPVVSVRLPGSDNC